MLRRLTPLHAQSFVNVSRDGQINQILVYDFYDPGEEYTKLMRNNKNRFIQEVERLWDVMQEILDREEHRINGVRVKPEVIFADIQFRGSPNLPYIYWVITVKAPVKKGVNVFEVEEEEEKLEYDVEVQWVFPEDSKVLEVTSKMEYDIYDNLVVLWARTGDIVGGKERVRVLIR